ncbi:MAG: hypothetical protein ABI592_12630 [Acidobacteriota bacterium]
MTISPARFVVRRRLAGAILAAGLAASFARAAEPEPEARAVESLEWELVAAISRTDLAAYDRIVADDYDVASADASAPAAGGSSLRDARETPPAAI